MVRIEKEGNWPVLHTKRLILRPWRDEDAEPFAKMCADPVVMEYFPSVLTREETDELMGRIRGRWEEDGYGLWAVSVRDGAPFIGFVGLIPRGANFAAPFVPAVEVGWRLAREHWGKGYATEAAKAALTFGFHDLGLEEIVSFTPPANERSRRVMERLGMARDVEGDFDHPSLPEGHPLRRHVLYRLRRKKRGRPQWRQLKKKWI